MGSTKACDHVFVEFARTTEGPVGILMGCRRCPATKTDWPGLKAKRRRA